MPCLGAFLFCGCAHSKAATPTGIKTANLRVTSEISGWAETPSTYQTFTTVDQLAGDVGLDGEAYLYSNKGLINGIYQKLASTAGYRMELYILDFGSQAGASAVFAEVTATQVTNGIAVGAYPRTTAIFQDNGNSAITYARIGRFFFKLSTTDYGGAISNATNAAILLLDFYKRRIGQ